ncbi:hypothetical protein M0802_007312 [Mischocyttarus mexicanus]|nr:hypothetical protein M0802_007312 [Mischocyttarus mexicanus]
MALTVLRLHRGIRGQRTYVYDEDRVKDKWGVDNEGTRVRERKYDPGLPSVQLNEDDEDDHEKDKDNDNTGIAPTNVHVHTHNSIKWWRGGGCCSNLTAKDLKKPGMWSTFGGAFAEKCQKTIEFSKVVVE